MKLQAGSVAKRSSEAAGRGESLIACREALQGAEDYLAHAHDAIRRRVANGGPLDAQRLDREQFAAHGFAWIATYVAALGELLDWAERLEAVGQLGELETLILEAGFGEYLSQLAGGIALSQVEMVRPGDLGLEAPALAPLESLSALSLRHNGNAAPTRMRIADLLIASLDSGTFGATGLGDETLEAMRQQMRRFADSKTEEAQAWHRADKL
ncbi:MAG: acyl-CoA dehydrogenase family protein, partial [Kiloniellales bacterium]